MSLPAARLGAKVLATDWSPAMIERFEARVREEGLPDAEGRVMDCHALQLEDNTFDVTGSQFGVMLVPDQPRALREMVRVTKPGGRVLVIAYGPPAELEFLHLFIGALQAVDPGLRRRPRRSAAARVSGGGSGGLAPAADRRGAEGRADRAERRAAGFRSGQELWDWVLYGNPLPGMLVAGLSDGQRARSQVLDGMVRERADATGRAIVENRVNIGIGPG